MQVHEHMHTMHAYIHKHTCTHTHTYTHMHAHTRMHTHTCTRKCTHTHITIYSIVRFEKDNIINGKIIQLVI